MSSLLILGSSVAAGQGAASASSGWVSLFAKEYFGIDSNSTKTHSKLDNRAIGGTTTDFWLQALSSDLHRDAIIGKSEAARSHNTGNLLESSAFMLSFLQTCPW